MAIAGAWWAGAAPLLGASTVELACAVSSSDGTSEMTESIISGGMNALFDAGHVATDAASLMMDEAAWRNPSLGMAEARAGFVDFVLSFYIIYKASSVRSGKFMPSSVNYRLQRAADGKILLDGSVATPPDTPDSFKNLEKFLRAIGTSMVKACLPALAGSGGKS